MLTFNETGRQISPCIAAKAKYALNNQRNKPTNKKRCAKKYWDNVIDTLCENDRTLNTNRENAKEMYNELIPKK
jgi:hypothetical protein